MEPSSQQTSMQIKKQHKSSVVGGLVLVALGVLFLMDNLLPDFHFHDYWPIILVVVGIGMLWNSYHRQ